MTDLSTLTPAEQQRLRDALRALPSTLRLSDVDWSAVLAAIRPGAVLDLATGTVGDALATLDAAQPDYGDEMSAKLDGITANLHAAPLPDTFDDMSVAEKLCLIDDERLTKSQRRRLGRDVERFFAKHHPTVATVWRRAFEKHFGEL